LSTVHSAKGLEWDSLFVIWLTDGWFPSNGFRDEFDDLEEERRLLYVGTTRAKRELNFVYPLNVYRYENDAVPCAITVSSTNPAHNSSTCITVGRGVEDAPATLSPR
jgi:superfamily I DNA/RNA helicase